MLLNIILIGAWFWVIQIIISTLIFYITNQPGHRRCWKDPKYEGPERRISEKGKEHTLDFFGQPAFSDLGGRIRGKITIVDTTKKGNK